MKDTLLLPFFRSPLENRKTFFTEYSNEIIELKVFGINGHSFHRHTGII